MLKVGQLIKHLSQNPVENNPLLVSFINYLNYFLDPDTVLLEENIDTYLSICMDFAHWQQHRHEFSQELKPILDGHLDLKAIRWPELMQSFEVENLADLTDILQVYLNAQLKNGEKYRLVLDSDKRVFAIVLNLDRSLQVRIFDRKVVIRHGQLEPLKKHQCITYNENLELDLTLQHCLELAPYVTASFKFDGMTMDGAVVRNYMLQKVHDLSGLELNMFPKLFYTIKRIEQYFIQRESDPLYQETIQSLERGIEKVRLADNYDHQEFLDILARAYNILEYVFTGDKLLTLLIRDLQHTISSKDSSVVRTPQKEDSWNLKIPLKAKISSDLTN